jgi:hypothetical protein
MYRLYVDEVGTDDLTHSDKDMHRYLSLTGVAIKQGHARDELEANLNWIKSEVFDQDPDDVPLIFHRTDIVGRKGPFGVLKDLQKTNLFDRAVLRLVEVADFAVITALIDKHWMLRQRHWANRDPYVFLMGILAEKYVRFLERRDEIGDLMPEARKGEKDARLQAAFTAVRDRGTEYVTSDRIKSALRGKALKFRTKENNVAGLQLCDLLAHPSHMNVRRHMGHNVTLGPFAEKIVAILEEGKYDRSSNGKIVGYGIKHLPL